MQIKNILSKSICTNSITEYFEIFQNRDNASSLTSIFNLDNPGSPIIIFLAHFNSFVCAWKMKKKMMWGNQNVKNVF